MTTTHDPVHALVRKLRSDDPTPLDANERELIIAALERLAAGELTLAQLQRQLMLHEQSAARIEAIARDAAAQIRTRLETPAAADFDFQASELARRDLLQRLDEARSGAATLRAVLEFVHDLRVILR